jgi:hypothetical protein
MLEGLFPFIFWPAVLLCFFTSVRFSVEGFLEIPQNRLISFATWRGWLIFLVLEGLWLVGDFGRGQSSPMPWKEFIKVSQATGILDGVLKAVIVATVDLWLLWTSANIYLNKALPKPPRGERTVGGERRLFERPRLMLRLINVLAGLLLMTKGNPIYLTLLWLAQHGASGPEP